MTKFIAAIALIGLLPLANAALEINRCETANKIVYWTPTPCAAGDHMNGTARIADDRQYRPYHEIVRVSECRWQASMLQNRKEPPLPPGTAQPTKLNWDHCK